MSPHKPDSSQSTSELNTMNRYFQEQMRSRSFTYRLMKRVDSLMAKGMSATSHPAR